MHDCKQVRIVRDEKNNMVEIRLGPVDRMNIWVYGVDGHTPEVVDQDMAQARAFERSQFWKKHA